MTRTHIFPFLLLLLILPVACRSNPETEATPETAVAPQATAQPATPAVAPTLPPSPEPTPPPSPTPPLAALVNGQPILLADYEREVARYEQTRPESAPEPGTEGTEYHALVLDKLIERELIRQAAVAAGLEVTPQMVDEKLAELRAAEDADLTTWLEANGWDEAEFRRALALELLVGQMIVAITRDVPFTAEQVRARTIQVDDAALAQSLLQQIRAGADFAALAQNNSEDRLTAVNGGDLGYFARGSLLVPEVETAAFALQAGEVSEVITVTDPENGRTTYYLVQLIERDPNRPLPAERRQALLEETFSTWLAERLQEATITRLIDPTQQ